MLRNKTFAPEFCSLISNWFDMREQAPPGANLLHESVSIASSLVCTEILLAVKWHVPSWPIKLAYFFTSRAVRRHVGFITTSSHAPIGLCHHSASSSCPSCVLVGVLTRERISGACFRGNRSSLYTFVGQALSKQLYLAVLKAVALKNSIFYRKFDFWQLIVVSSLV